jgi:hypothetical protein
MTEGTAGADSPVQRVVDAASSRPIVWWARLGLVARGLVYLFMGLIGLSIAFGNREPVDQKSALSDLLSLPLGIVVVSLCGVGFLGYAVWRFSEALGGAVVDGDSPTARTKSFARGVIYLLLAFTAFSVVLGSRTTQGSQQRGMVAWALTLPGGQVLVGVIGVVVAGIGLGLAIEGARGKFLGYLDRSDMTPRRRRLVRVLGMVGSVLRGCVVVYIGVILIGTAIANDPSQATGMDGAFQLMARAPYEWPQLVLLSGGLVVFGIYGLMEARYRRVGTHGNEG